MPMPIRHVLIAAAVVAISVVVPTAQTAITSPRAQFGFNLGDDYQLVNYTQLADYWRKLDAESDRMVLQEIGKTSEGRPHLMAIVTSPDNHRNLTKYQDISRRLLEQLGRRASRLDPLTALRQE